MISTKKNAINDSQVSTCHLFLSPQVEGFNANELQFRQGVANIVNENSLVELPRVRRQVAALNATADDVFIVGPSPLTTGSGVTTTFFVQTNGEVVNGTELTTAVQNEGANLAQQVRLL